MELTADVAILGSGFAGSLTGMILARGGLKPVVIDRTAHPRFAIGESSTPVANFVLRDLANQYDLPGILPLTKFGSWQRTYPKIVGGLKRGFSYFPHRPKCEFVADREHRNELLVAASSSDEHSDTQWLRADVDAHFAREMVKLGVPLYERTTLSSIQPLEEGSRNARWELNGERQGQPLTIHCRFVIDATGEGGALANALGIRVSADRLATRSRAVFSHFRKVGSWHDWLVTRGAAVADHPFNSDDAAQHHLLDGAWMYVLRFTNGVTSAGFAIDANRFPQPPDLTPEQEWELWLNRYPSVADLFRDSTIVDPPGRILRSGILPRRADRAAGPGWAMLPHTAGFIDPLHSTGIAHSLCGVERLTEALLNHWDHDSLAERLSRYEQAVFSELAVMDKLVHGCYESLGNFRLFTAYSMLYFVAAHWYEQHRKTMRSASERWFLNAHDPEFVRMIQRFHIRLVEMTRDGSSSDREVVGLEQDVELAIEPYNAAGLFHPDVHNMYRFTAAT